MGPGTGVFFLLRRIVAGGAIGGGRRRHNEEGRLFGGHREVGGPVGLPEQKVRGVSPPIFGRLVRFGNETEKFSRELPIVIDRAHIRIVGGWELTVGLRFPHCDSLSNEGAKCSSPFVHGPEGIE